MTRQEIIKRLDRLVQTCARYRGAKKRKGVWINKCVTCGAIKAVGKGIQGGHFIPRGCHFYRWDERNVNPQCSQCNGMKGGAYIEYSGWFIKTHGQELFHAFLDDWKDSRQGKKRPLNMGELRKLHDVWLERGRTLEKETGLSLFPKSWERLIFPQLIEDL